MGECACCGQRSRSPRPQAEDRRHEASCLTGSGHQPTIRHSLPMGLRWSAGGYVAGGGSPGRACVGFDSEWFVSWFQEARLGGRFRQEQHRPPGASLVPERPYPNTSQHRADGTPVRICGPKSRHFQRTDPIAAVNICPQPTTNSAWPHTSPENSPSQRRSPELTAKI